MKIMIIDTTSGRVEVAVEENKVVALAGILEVSGTVNTFYIDGLNVAKQQNLYGCGGYTKWISPIQQ